MTETEQMPVGAVAAPRWWRSRLLLAVLILGAVVLVVLVAAPMAVRYLAEDWLRGAGATEASIANVDLNPFSGVLVVEGVLADGGGRRLQLDHVSVDVDWWPLFSRRVFVPAVGLRGLRADVLLAADGSVQVGGVRLPAAGPDDEATEPLDWAVGLGQLAMDDVAVKVDSEPLGVSVDVSAVRIGEVSQWQADTATPINLQLTVDGAPITVDAKVWPFAAGPRLTGRLQLDGADLGRYRQLLADAGVADVAGRLTADLELDASLSEAGVLRLATSGSVRAADLAAGFEGATVANRELAVVGNTVINVPAADSADMATFDGKVTLADIVLNVPEPVAELRQDSIAWQGRLSVAGDGAAVVRGGIEVGGVGLAAPGVALGVQLVRLDGLDVQSVGTSISLTGARLEDIRLGPDTAQAAPVMSAGSVAVGAVSASTTSAEIEFLDIDVLALDVLVRKDGTIALIEALEQLVPAEVETEETAVVSESPDNVLPASEFAWSLGRLAVTGDSRIRVTDESVEPQLQTRLQPVTLTITDLASDGRPAHIDLQAEQGNTSRLSVTGQFQPLAERLSGDLSVVLSGLNLPQLSGYVPGYNLDQGRLSVESKVRIENDSLDVDNRIVIERLKLVARQGKEVPFLSEGLAMPLDVVLDLLRDTDDAIRLRVPITGDVNAPEFGTGQVVRRALRGALQKAAVSYVKNVLQPLGTLVMVGQMAGKAMRPRFEPVSFAAGSATLDDTATTYIASIGKLLGERPRLSLTLCGVATEADRAALAATAAAALPPTEVLPTDAPATSDTQSVEPVAPVVADAALQELAESRADGVRGQLLRAHGIVAERLFACLPQLEAEAESAPRVDVML